MLLSAFINVLEMNLKSLLIKCMVTHGLKCLGRREQGCLQREEPGWISPTRLCLLRRAAGRGSGQGLVALKVRGAGGGRALDERSRAKRGLALEGAVQPQSLLFRCVSKNHIACKG